MAKLHVAVILAVIMALVFVTVEGKSKRLRARDLGETKHRAPCTDNPERYPYLPLCPTTSTQNYETTKDSTTDKTITTTEEDDVEEDDSHDDTTSLSTDSTSTSTPSSLQRAHWCRVVNGSYLPYNYTYMQNACVMCKCTTSHAIRCQAIQCMPTYCIDDSKPIRQSGQCCTQCPYEASNTSCTYNGVTYQHGALMKVVEDKMQCWCQLGNIECRDYAGALFSGTDLFSDGTAIYIIVIVICFALILGLFTCCACTLFTYYYYNKYQTTIQQAYDEYVNTSGWQPMEEEQNPADLAAEEKHFEAENGQYLVPNVEIIPPPYAAVHNINISADEQQQK